MKIPSTIGLVYIAGTLATFLVAYVLVKKHQAAAAGAVILISPFPCPPGLPC